MRPIIGPSRGNSNTFACASPRPDSEGFNVSPKAASAHAMQRSCMHREAPLGTYTKSSPTLPNPKTLQPPSALARKVARYLLQTSARGLILEEYYSSLEERIDTGLEEGEYIDIPLEDYNKLHKIVKCNRTRIKRSVTIHKCVEGRAFYSGLVVCSSVWACPVCAAKIQERRRIEISHAMDHAYTEMGKQCSMITLTFPHKAMDSCADLREKQKLALKTFREGGTWSRKMTGYGFEGLIRSLEITHGKNGWHPHTHELWIMDYFNEEEEEEFRKYILAKWEKACQKHGLIPKGKLRAFRRHAVDVKFSVSNSDYLAKQDNEENLHWGIDREMAKGTSKASGKEGAPSKGLHPFQLLDGFSQGQYWMGGLFLEYVKAMKGASQLYWSPGLKKKCKIEELTDKELIEKEEEKAIDLADLDMFAWDKVLEKKARAEVLNIAEIEGLAGLISWFGKYGIDLFYDSRPADFRRDDFDQIPKSKVVNVDTLNLDFLHS